MTNDKQTRRNWLIGAAVAILGACVVARELLRSGTVGEGLVRHWYGETAFTVLFLAAVGAAMYLLHRAYRR